MIYRLARDRRLFTILLPICGMIALIWYVNYNEDRASNQGTTIGSVVRTLDIRSNCLPKPGETKPRRPAACKEEFDQAIRYLTSTQACRIVQKAVPLLYLNGRQIGEVVCQFPEPTKDEGGQSEKVEVTIGSTPSSSSDIPTGTSGNDNPSGTPTTSISPVAPVAPDTPSPNVPDAPDPVEPTTPVITPPSPKPLIDLSGYRKWLRIRPAALRSSFVGNRAK